MAKIILAGKGGRGNLNEISIAEVISRAVELKTRASGAVGVGLSLDPEGRKRLWGSSFALKSRERSFLDFQLLLIFFYLKSHFFDNYFFDFPQFATRGEVICDHRMLQFWIFSRPKLIFP